MRQNSSSSSNGCGCGGCITALVVGTIIVGTISLGGCTNAWLKLKSTWNYDNQIQAAQRAFDKNKNGRLEEDEQVAMYRALGLPTINEEVSTVKIPYKVLVEYHKRFGQEF